MFIGYKCFNKGLINRYGTKFRIEKTYHCDKQIKFGNNGHGFHVCKRLEDTLRYFDAMNKEVDICIVECYGKYDKQEDDYYDYYDMFAFEYMVIKKLLTREEIISYGLELFGYQLERFISLFKLTKEEIDIFKHKFQKESQILKFIAYYQEGDKDAFNTDIEYTKKRKI